MWEESKITEKMDEVEKVVKEKRQEKRHGDEVHREKD